MSTDLFLPCFTLFAFSGAFLWLVGAAAFFREDWPESPYCAPWLGYGILVGVLQVVHLFSPITLAVSILVLATASVLASVVLIARWLKKRPDRKSIRRWVTFFILLAVIALLTFVPVFNCCTKEVFPYDLGLYYLQTIRWTETYPIVRGLVNLQPHLGFNQSAFLVASVFDSLAPNRWGIFLIGALLPWLGLSLSAFAMLRMAIFLFRREAGPPIEIAYAVVLARMDFRFARKQHLGCFAQQHLILPDAPFLPDLFVLHRFPLGRGAEPEVERDALRRSALSLRKLE